ncbi:MAG: hypothetical protein DRP84_01380 [Spirochaetes bacterium]|nr:MAG: hypothetical protein DRP84_01380 [Spirochaetota bacterium]
MIGKISIYIFLIVITFSVAFNIYANEDFLNLSQDELIIKARDCSEQGDYEGAIEIYEYLLENNPANKRFVRDLEIVYRSLFNTYRYGSLKGRFDLGKLKRYFRKEDEVYRKYNFSSLVQFYGFFILGVGIIVLFDSWINRKRREGPMPVVFSKHNMWQNGIILFFLICLLVAYRFFLWRAQANNSEFLFRGLLGKDLIDGLKANFFYYRTSAHDGSASLVGLLCVPFFILFGDSFFSLYLVGLLIPISILILLYYFTARYFSPSSAIIACFLYILVPFQYLVYSTYMLGFHTDSPLFTLILFIIFFKVFFTATFSDIYYGRSESKGRRQKLYWLFIIGGLISGFALSFCYTFILSLFIFIFFWFIVDPGCIRKRYFYLFGLCFLISFLPWILFNIRDNFSGLYIPIYKQEERGLLSLNLFFNTGGDWLVKWECLRSYLLHIFYSEPFKIFDRYVPRFVPRYLFCNILFIPLFVSFISALKYAAKFIRLRYIKKSTSVGEANHYLKEVMIFSYVILVLLMFFLHPSLWPSQNYLHPAFPFIFILVGLLIDKLFIMRLAFLRLRSVAFILVVVIVLSGFSFCQNAISGFLRFDVGSLRDMFTMKGYSLAHLPYYFMKELNKNNLLLSDLQVNFLYEEKMFNVFHNVLDAWIDSDSHRLNNWESVDKNYQVLEKIDLLLRPFTYIRLGITIGDGLHKDTVFMLPKKIKAYVDNKYSHFLYQGIAISYGNRQRRKIINNIKSDYIDAAIPQEYLHYFYIEKGRRVGEGCKNNYSHGISLLDEFDSAYYPYLCLGFVSSLPPAQIMYILKNNNPEYSFLKKCAYFFYGKNIYDDTMNYDRNNLNEYIEVIPEPYLPECICGLVYGFSEDAYYYFQESEKFDPVKIMKDIKENIFKNGSMNSQIRPYIYQGLGLSLSVKSMGFLNYDAHRRISLIVPSEYMNDFYKGYGIGIGIRYGKDKKRKIELIDELVPSQYKELVNENAASVFLNIKR